jgi:NOL1/NOP2/sun family putative RNA methylase
MDLPAQFLRRMEHLLGDEYAAFDRSYTLPAASGLRVNLLKVTPAEIQTRLPYQLTPLAGCPEGFLVEGEGQPGKHPYHAAGLYYLQDPSAMLVGIVVDPQPGERVLDLSAAPGGKATHIAARLGSQGLLVANEIHNGRAWELAENLERWGARNVVVTNETPAHLSATLPDFFDRVLLDAPCSGEGMFRKSLAARRDWSPELVQSCAVRQGAILSKAASMVRPGGWLIYSTCTFSPEENEGSVARFLEAHPEFELQPIPELPGAAQGRPDWVEGGLSRAELVCTVRLWPHRHPGEGQFIARMRRKDGDGIASHAPARLPRLPAEVQRMWQDFADQALVFRPDSGRLALYGSYLYQIPPGLPETGRLKIIHPGWWLGSVKTRRVEPSQALAMALSVEEARLAVSLDLESAEAYLHGHSLPLPGEEGWVLVTVNGFPLGWGKRVQGVLKNYYPRGLRWL